MEVRRHKLPALNWAQKSGVPGFSSSAAAILEALPLGTCVIQDNSIQMANEALLQLLGYSLPELKNIPLRRLLLKTDYFRILKAGVRRLAGQEVREDYQFTLLKRNQTPIRVKGFFAVAAFNGAPALLVQMVAIPPDTLPRNDDEPGEGPDNYYRYKELLDSLPEVVFEMDPHGGILFANCRAFDFFGVTPSESLKGINALDYVIPEDQEKVRRSMETLLQGTKEGVSEYIVQRKDGSTFPAMFHSTRVLRNGRPVGLRGVIIDITERKQMEERIYRLSQFDALTGIHNRAHFENEMQKLQKRRQPFGIIVCDVDGLKLINDTMGHRYGDQLISSTAKIIKEHVRSEDIVARIGGDEFAIILANTDETIIRKLIHRLQVAVIASNRDISKIPLTLSCGFAVSADGSGDPESIFKEADNNMFKEKLFHNQSNRSAVIQTLQKALEARDFITEGHAERLQNFVLELATSVGLSETRKNDLRLLAQFHDIGKVGIPDRILFKNSRLNKAEMAKMQRHCEIGYRIAQASPDLAHIADWILKHHEWWNGGGYPLGLKGEEIPLECRILSIVDAFDAITNDRPYRKARSCSDAVQEIRNSAGIQFDPDLVEKFIEVVEYRI